MSSPTVYVETTRTIPKEEMLIEAVWRRDPSVSGVDLFVKSSVIRSFFASLPQTDAFFHKGWKQELFSPKALPRVTDVTFDSAQAEFEVADPNRGYNVMNAAFLRAKKLDEGFTLHFGPLVTESELNDMKKRLERVVLELYRDYMAPVEEEFKITTRKAVRV